MVPFADHDLRGYLNPVMNAYRYHFLGHYNFRSFLYPLFLLAVTRISDSLNGVTIVQHLLGLMTGFLIFSIWEQPFIKNYTETRIKWVATILQFVSTAYFLLAGGIIFFEHSIRPESTAIFLMVFLLFLLLKRLSRSNVLILSSAFFISLGLFIFFPRWGWAMPISLIFILLSIIKTDKRPSIKTLAIVAPAMLFIVFILWPERYLVKKYDPETDNFAARQFFYAHADIARELLIKQAGCNAIDVSTGQFIAAQLTDTPAADKHFALLGFNPDKLMYGQVGTSIDSALRAGKDTSYTFYKKADAAMLSSGLGKYIKRVGRELLAYYGYNTGFERIYLYEQPIYYNMYAETKVCLFPEMDDAGSVFKNYRSNVSNLSGYTQYSLFTFINLLYFLMQLTFLLTIFFFVIAFIAINFAFKDRRGDTQTNFKHLGTGCWLLLSIHFGMVLTIASIHSFGIERYGISIFPVAILTQCFCLFYIAVTGNYLLRHLDAGVGTKKDQF